MIAQCPEPGRSAGDAQAFCARLKAAREQKGIPLSRIVETTKISPTLLRDLERGELGRWPKGIYRRSYLRDYLFAVGLPAEPAVTEFLLLFPDCEAAPEAPVEQPVKQMRPLVWLIEALNTPIMTIRIRR